MKLNFILLGMLLISSCANNALSIDESGSWQEWALSESIPERDLFDACERAPTSVPDRSSFLPDANFSAESFCEDNDER